MIVNNKLERIWKEAVLLQLKTPCKHFSAVTVDKHNKPYSGQCVSEAIFKTVPTE
jgi:hypothetical protein